MGPVIYKCIFGVSENPIINEDVVLIFNRILFIFKGLPLVFNSEFFQFPKLKLLKGQIIKLNCFFAKKYLSFFLDKILDTNSNRQTRD